MERITEQTEVKKLCGQIDTVTEELAVLKRLLMEEENFFQMLTLGEIGKETRLEWMRDIFGSHISDETLACTISARCWPKGWSFWEKKDRGSVGRYIRWCRWRRKW